MTSHTTVEQRLDRLERTNRRWRAACLVTGLALLCVVAVGQAPKKPKALPAQKIDGRLVVDELVVQEDGKDRIMLIARDGNTLVAQMNDKGEPVLICGTNKESGPFVSMRDSHGKPRLTTTVTDEGTGVSHLDAQGRTRITTSTIDGGTAYTSWHDAAGQSRVTGAASETQGVLNVADERGTPRIMITSSGAGGSVALQDGNGRVRLAESVENNQVLGLLYDELGRQRVKTVQIGVGDATTYYMQPDNKGGSTLLRKLP
ncbi:MAG: hypothetical protein GC159_02265 [Phycisphaera sp.]|nr:hypothetical protein [Phycisphaera sp.]